jgi:hypothetical protein
MLITGMGNLLPLHIPKTSRYFRYISLRNNHFGITVVRTSNSEQMMWENATSRSNTSDIMKHCYVDDSYGTEEINDSCGKMNNMGTMDRDFTLCENIF